SRTSPSPVCNTKQATARARLDKRSICARWSPRAIVVTFGSRRSMEFGILGPVEVVEGGRVVAPGPLKQRALLAILLLHVNEVVPRDRLIEELWGEWAPQTAATSLHTYVSHLRKLLEAGDGAEPRLLLTRAPGYLLALDPDQLDLTRFERLAPEGKQQRAPRHPPAAPHTPPPAPPPWPRP